jgi:hypothetical protein
MSDIRYRVTALETAEEVLRARLRQQEATGGLGLAALSGMSLPDLMDEAAYVVAEVLAVEYCDILELVPEGAALLLRAGVGWRGSSGRQRSAPTSGLRPATP